MPMTDDQIKELHRELEGIRVQAHDAKEKARQAEQEAQRAARQAEQAENRISLTIGWLMEKLGQNSEAK